MYILTHEPQHQPQPHDSIIPMYTLTPEPQPQPHDSIIPVLKWFWGKLTSHMTTIKHSHWMKIYVPENWVQN